MKCVLCREGDTAKGHTTVTLERDGSIILFRGVPAQVCVNCGEAYVDISISEELLRIAEEEVRSGAELVLRDFGAISAH